MLLAPLRGQPRQIFLGFSELSAAVNVCPGVPLVTQRGGAVLRFRFSTVQLAAVPLGLFWGVPAPCGVPHTPFGPQGSPSSFATC